MSSEAESIESAIANTTIIEKTMRVVYMKDRYEYHKRNDYPGERKDEKKRVADRAEADEKVADERVAEKGKNEKMRANNRVARKGRRDEKVANERVAEEGRNEKMKANNRVARKGRDDEEKLESVKEERNRRESIGMAVIAGLAILLMAGAMFGYMAMSEQRDAIDELNSQLDQANSDKRELRSQLNGQSSFAGAPIDETSPEIVQVSPQNGEMGISVDTAVTVTFNEEMNAQTINEETFTVMQRTTPESGNYQSMELEGEVTYNNGKATFIPDSELYPNQIYGNVFTATLSSAVEDKDGNSLGRDYIWSFTTGNSPYNSGATTSQSC